MSFNRVENAPVEDDRQRIIAELEPEYKCPVTWADGPVRNQYRKVTDKCCHALFFLYLLAMIGTAIWAFLNADPQGVVKVLDSSGNVCGQGATKDFPLIFLQTYKAPFRSVCVKECPRFDYNQIKYNSAGSSSYPGGGDIPVMGIKEFNRKHAGLSHTTSADMTENEAFAFNRGWANGYFTEEQWNDYLRRFKLDCFSNSEVPSCTHDGKSFFLYDSYPVGGLYCAPLSPKAGLMFNRVSSKFDVGTIGDMMYALPLFGWVALAALGMSFLFLAIITTCTTLITWFLIIVCAFTLLGLGAAIISNYAYTGPLNDAWNTLRVKYLEFLIENKVGLLVLAAVLILLGLLVFVVMCKYRKSINVAIPLITIASRSSLKNFLLLALSAFVVLVQIFVFFLEVYIIMKIYSTGEQVRENVQGSPFVSHNRTLRIDLLMALHIFGTYWLIGALNNLNDFVCAAVSVNFYWTSQIENMRIFCHTLGHHIGSIAWSLILLPIYAVKLCFGWLDWLTSSDHPNALQRLVRKLMCPCCWFYERFIDVVSESYFAITYLGSENFWPATKRYYYLSEKYYDQSSTISFVGGLFSLVGKTLITFATVAIAYAIYKESIEYQQNIDNVGALFALAGLVGFFIGSLFINLFATTYDAMLTCYLVELNIQDTAGRAITKCPEELREVMRELNSGKAGGYNRLE